MPKCLTGNGLKLIAVVSMTADHAGAILFPQQLWLRCVGRLAFVLYAFLLTEGYVHTHDVGRYLIRLLVMAILSEIPYDLMITGAPVNPSAQNVYFTLFLGLLAIAAADRIRLHCVGQMQLLAWIPVLLACAAAGLLRSDYSVWGIAMIVCFYLFRGSNFLKYISVSTIQMIMGGIIQVCAIAGLLPIACYNGRRGCTQRWLQAAFYIYYPLHMLVIACISVLL